MPFTLPAASIDKLQGVHEDLVKVVRAACQISTVPFIVTEGLRTMERQKEMVATGKSQTYNSRHLSGHAVDLAAVSGGQVSWDWKLYEKIADAMLQAAGKLNIPIVWGGSWSTLKDGPHFELNRNYYPSAESPMAG